MLQQQQLIRTGWHFRLKSRSKGKSKPCERIKNLLPLLKTLFGKHVYVLRRAEAASHRLPSPASNGSTSPISRIGAFFLPWKKRLVTYDEPHAHAARWGTHVAHGGRLFVCCCGGTEAQVHDRQPCGALKRLFFPPTDYSGVSW